MMLINKFIDLNIIEKEDTDLYEYSVNILKNYIFFILIITIGNFFTKNYIQTLAFLLLFFSLRKHTGGLHLDKSMACLLLSSALVLVVPYLCSVVYISFPLLISIQSLLSILLCTIPIVDNPKKTESKKYKRIFKKKVLIKVIAYLFINILFFVLNKRELSMIVLFTILISYLSVLTGYVKYKYYIKENI